MPLVNVSHKPVTGTARQFDGTLAALTDILTGRSNAGITVTCTFNQAGAFTGLRIDGGGFGNVAVSTGDWVVFPTDPTKKALSVTAAEAALDWATV